MVQLALLVLPQSLQGEQTERSALPATDDLLQYRQVKDERLPRRRRRRDEHVLPSRQRLEPLDLMRPQSFDAARRQGARQRLRQRRVEVTVARRLLRQIQRLDDLWPESPILAKRFDQRGESDGHEPMVSEVGSAAS